MAVARYFDQASNEWVVLVKGHQGEPGDPGPPGTVEDVQWSDVQGRPAEFPPEEHEHTMSDIADLPRVSEGVLYGTIVQRKSDGTIPVYREPKNDNDAVSKQHLDHQIATRATPADVAAAVEGKADKAEVPTTAADVGAATPADVEARTPRIEVVTTLPTSPNPNTVYVVVG